MSVLSDGQEQRHNQSYLSPGLPINQGFDYLHYSRGHWRRRSGIQPSPQSTLVMIIWAECQTQRQMRRLFRQDARPRSLPPWETFCEIGLEYYQRRPLFSTAGFKEADLGATKREGRGSADRGCRGHLSLGTRSSRSQKRRPGLHYNYKCSTCFYDKQMCQPLEYARRHMGHKNPLCRRIAPA